MITKAQQLRIRAYYDRSPDGSPSYLAFRRRWKLMIFSGGAIGATWCGMFVGIEPDGYGHT